MKIKAVICFIVLFCGLVISLHAQMRYVRNIPIQIPAGWDDYQYTPTQIYPCPDGGVMILGDCTIRIQDMPSDHYDWDCGVVKLDADGNCEWQWWSSNFNTTGEPHIIGIDQEADGRVNFLINAGFNYNQIGWIDLQENYSLLNIQLPTCYINRAMRLSDNTIFAIGSSYPIDLNSHIFFTHLNAEGDTISTRNYHSDSLWVYFDHYAATACDMELDTDGMPVSTCIFTDRFASVVKTDWDGNIIWRRDTNYQTCSEPIPITKLPVTNELVFGYHAYNNHLFNQFVINKITTDGIDSLFTIQMSTSIGGGSYYSMLGHNQGIYLSGCYGGDGIIREYISNYNLFGYPIWTWSHYYGLNFEHVTESIIELLDNNIMHTFSDSDFGNYGLYVVKLHPDGTSNEEDIIPLPAIALNAYPNPMKYNINIEFISDINSKKQWITTKIYNIKGQIIKTIDLNRKSEGRYTAIWDGKDSRGFSCSPGAYIMKMRYENDTLVKKILLLK